ncbi:acyl carrier protein/NADH dehydrogenase (ubiquinone) 1 alpha/beta subcomplex 1 [Pseudomonas guariconensis]|uniref:acyl carrier protein n=1 Tax=Pseudomonas guariconensis TaxID=1288410 RepID=UPI000891DF70|nr:acyl carrier protein [Pseudomonas guariconensis]SDC54364.1 acyl carrier protein/NADH dehydrogenase (ubiquinone) 1 alpha/beta subcomplex 1 [Pseudomonas guariconensis]
MQVTRDDIIGIIREAKVVESPEALRSDVSLTDQGIDSLGMFSVVLALQEKYAIEIPESDIDGLNSINDFIGYLSKCLT